MCMYENGYKHAVGGARAEYWARLWHAFQSTVGTRRWESVASGALTVHVLVAVKAVLVWTTGIVRHASGTPNP